MNVGNLAQRCDAHPRRSRWTGRRSAAGYAGSNRPASSLDRRCGNISHRLQPILRKDEVEPVPIFDATNAADIVCLAQSSDDVLQAQPQSLRLGRIDIDRELAWATPEHIDARNPADSGKCRAHGQFGDLA